MITGASVNSGKISDKTTRSYYVLMDDCIPVGVCSNIESARACLHVLAKEKKAGRIEGLDVYVYEDSSGSHSMTIRVVRRLKMVR